MFETKADIEQALLKILADNRPGTEVRGCVSPLEVYAYQIQSQIIEPLWRARASAGLIDEIEDMGHQLSFTAGWNRAIAGESEDWDCRILANTFLWGALCGVPDMMGKQMAQEYDAIDDAILRNLPEILFGDASTRWSSDALSSWVTGEHVRMEMDGLVPRFFDTKDRALRFPPPYRRHIDLVEMPERETCLYALMSFHGPDIDSDRAQRAWEIWRAATGKTGANKRGIYASLYGRMSRSMKTAYHLSMPVLDLLQDEAVSCEIRPEGAILYRGRVEGLEAISDEGKLVAGPRTAFIKMLVAGGFDRAEADEYLNQLVSARSAFQAPIPKGSSFRFALDPEIHLRRDAGEDWEQNLHITQSREEAYPLVVAGCFGPNMPEMPTWREIQERRAGEGKNLEDIPSPGY